MMVRTLAVTAKFQCLVNRTGHGDLSALQVLGRAGFQPNGAAKQVNLPHPQLLARKEDAVSLEVKGNLPFYVYNKVVDPRLIVDEVTHLPPMAFDRQFFEDIQLRTDRALEAKYLRQTRFGRDVSRMWARATEELGVTNTDVTRGSHPFQGILELYVELVRRTFHTLSQPIALGVASSFLIALSMFYFYAERQTNLLQAQIAALHQSEEAARTERTLAVLRRLDDMAPKLYGAYDYLSATKSEEAKIERIETDVQFRVDFGAALSLFEDLGYEYNHGLLDQDLAKRKAGVWIVRYYSASRFWIDYQRRRAGRPDLYKEFQAMADGMTTSTSR